MSSIAFNYIPASAANGAFTAVNFSDFATESFDGGYFLDAYNLIVSGTVPANTNATLTLYLGAVPAATDIVNNGSNPNPVSIGVNIAVSISANGKQFSFIGLDGNPHTGTFPTDGFWADGFSLLASVSPSGPLQIDQYYLVYSGLSFSGVTPPNSPSDLALVTGPDEDTLTWTDNASDEIGNAIEISIFDGVDSTLFEAIRATPANGISAKVSTAQVRAIIAKGIADGVIANQASYDVYFDSFSFNNDGESIRSNEQFYTYLYSSGPLPDIDVTGSGGINLGGGASMIFLIDPSGIYTITPGKLHDTLYERLGSITTVNVKIPDPFIKTAFLGDE